MTLAAVAVASAAVPGRAADEEVFDCLIEPSRVVEVGAAAVGVLEEVRVEHGDVVEAGQVLAVLESGVEAATVDLARLRARIDTEVRAREVTFALQESNQRRTDRLSATRAVAEKVREEAEHDARLSKLRLRQAREEQRVAELELLRAEQALSRRLIRSPIDGAVTERHRSPGERVEDQPIVRVAQLDPLRVQVVLPVARYSAVQVGMRARVMPETGRGEAFAARVSSIDPVLDAASGTFGVRLSMPNPDHAIPAGLRCTLGFLPGPVEPPAGAAPAAAEREPAAAEPLPEPAVDDTPALPDAMQARLAAAAEREPAAAEPLPEPAVDDAPALPDEMQARPAPPADRAVPLPALPPVSAAVDAVESVGRACRVLGPFDSDEQALRVRERLAGPSVDAHLANRRQHVVLGYLAVVSGNELPGGTDEAVARLRRAGIQDFQVLTAMPGLVSVGYFNGPASADTRVEQMRAEGLPARVVPRTREKLRPVLDLTLSGAGNGDALIAAALSAEGVDGARLSPCMGVVTARR